jgi:hypothetical protein
LRVAELLAEGDCLWVSVPGGGKDVVIANPGLFRVEEVTAILVSFCSFAEAAYYSLKQNRVVIREFAETKVANELAKGVAAEMITGVVPLFVSERHWRIASLYLDRATVMLSCKRCLGLISIGWRRSLWHCNGCRDRLKLSSGRS